MLDATHLVDSGATVSLAELKQAAAKLLPPTSSLRMLLLSEPDFVPREEAVAKLEVFLRLLYQELAEGCTVLPSAN